MPITVSFECTTDQAYLLMTLHDLLKNSYSGQFSITAVENFDWLIDELAGVAPAVNDEKMSLSDNGLSLAALALLDYENKRIKIVNERIASEVTAKT